MKTHTLYCSVAFIASVQFATGAIIPDTNIDHCTIMSGSWSSPWWTLPNPYTPSGFAYGVPKGGINAAFSLGLGGANNFMISMMIDGGPTQFNPLYASWLLDNVAEPSREVQTSNQYWVMHWDAKYTAINENEGVWSGSYYVALTETYCASLPEGGPGVVALSTLFAIASLRRRR